MDKLVQLVADRAGISESQAQKAVQTIMGQLKEHLPGPLAGQVQDALTERESGGDGKGDLAGGLSEAMRRI